ncbi:efflux RND transporter permease subunit [Candidatus Parabeggiatoa sp. HSG14]|uniref:efflux RND transporter permease subunit n=1 Tax=Candidatus Parabeggiatoa sp. HSG14 TaxID=3055593 RepID=UPI0025A869E4|nr:efflux RND transporter permease subunit [Thiotrichales bacterium HSG14]
MQPFEHKGNLIGLFAQHKVAANLLMIMMIMAGIWALSKLNTQFLPNFELDIISITVLWTGATAEDIEISITGPIEQELRTLDHIRKMNSTSTNGFSAIILEFDEGTDMGWALDQVKEKVSLLRNLPSGAEKPEISRAVHYDEIARLLVTGPSNVNELRPLAQRIKHELLELGISKIEMAGLPDEEIAVQISTATLEELGMTLPQIGQQVNAFSRDLPAGAIGRDDVARQLRSLEQRRDELSFAKLPLIADKSGRYIKLDDVATIERRPRNSEVRITYQGKPAIELQLKRTEQSDSLASAKTLQTWLDKTRPQLPPGVEIHVYAQAWELIDQRISLLLKNGLGGLILVVGILFLFLNSRVAFWVAAGIPISLMGMLMVLYMVGGSINMVSLFAMIMALGVIVDDAIVVGEDGFTHFQTGEKSLLAAEGGAQRMLAPVTAASLTTICAFLPLMLISGPMGNILFDIPTVMICVLVASLFECFLVLPGHLRHSFHKLHHEKPNRTRLKLENGFNRIRDFHFRPLIINAVAFRWTVLAGVVVAMLLAVGLLKSGRLNFTFFPSPEGIIITTNANFVAGTSPERVDAFLEHVEKALYATDKELGADIVKVVVVRHGSASSGGNAIRRGDQFGSLMVELTSPDSRTIRNKQFIKVWQEKIHHPPGLEMLTVIEARGGPPGRDIEVRLNGNDPNQVKSAALELKNILKTFDGVTGIEDDMPFGREQWLYSLTPHGIALGLTIESVGRQLRAAFDGYLTQIFQNGEDEIEVRVMLPDEERYDLASLENFMLQLPNGARVPFSTAVQVRTQRGFEAIRHAQGLLAAQVSADVDASVANANEITANLVENVFPDLRSRYGVDYGFEGRMADQAETLADMQRGMLFALAMIYLILAWQFGSYGWPLIVMSVIPFGLVGAIFGHWVMGIDLTILSLFGFFGLSGIVINDSIVLVTFYKQLREEGMFVHEALVEASCQRLRAVLLTSLTTIFGLMPLLFETSLQAQFLIPMATSIAFGLMFSTVLVLLVVPVLLSIYERIMVRKEERGEVLI